MGNPVILTNDGPAEVLEADSSSGSFSFKFVIWALAFVHICAFLYWLFLLWKSKRESMTRLTQNRWSYDRLDAGRFEIKIPHRFLKVPGLGKKKYTH